MASCPDIFAVLVTDAVAVYVTGAVWLNEEDT
jgi:hypothetical protein